MKELLKQKLWTYLKYNHPDLALRLQESNTVSEHLDEKVNSVSLLVEQLIREGKPIYLIEEQCLNAMTEDLQPSRYNYICSLLSEEFPNEYEKIQESGTLTYEVSNMIDACKDIFEEFDFSVENEDNRFLKYAIIAKLHAYLL